MGFAKSLIFGLMLKAACNIMLNVIKKDFRLNEERISMKTGEAQSFRFYGHLRIFLSREKRKRPFLKYFAGKRIKIKDALRALGVPDTEVDCIVVNGKPAGLSLRLEGGEDVRVYPYAEKSGLAAAVRLKANPPAHPKFVVDAHLGKLAGWLRLFGFDSVYQNNFRSRDILNAAKSEKRIVLTRNAGILRNKRVKRGHFVRAGHPEKQIKEVFREYNLYGRIRPFKVCAKCNGRIVPVAKYKIAGLLPELTRKYYSKFYICKSCGKIYWRGAHFIRLAEFMKKIAKK